MSTIIVKYLDWMHSIDLEGIDSSQSNATTITFINLDGSKTVFTGSGFTYNAEGFPISGTVTQIAYQLADGTVLVTISGNLPTLDTIATYVDSIMTARAGIDWFDTILQDTDPVSMSSTQIIMLNSDGTYTYVNGTGLTFSPGGRPISGTVTTVEHRDSSGALISTVTVNQSAVTAAPILSDTMLQEAFWQRVCANANTIIDLATDPTNQGAVELFGMAGNDSFTGQAGSGFISYRAASGAVTVNLNAGTATGAEGSDTFSGIYGVIGSDFNDTLTAASTGSALIGRYGDDKLTGGSGSDFLIGGAGNDTISGGSGTDTVSYSDADNGVSVDLNVTAAQTTGDGNDTITGVENLWGSDFGDTLKGNGSANVIDGGDGDDKLYGRGGADTLVGGDGDDGLWGGDGVDSYDGGDGTDWINADSNTAGISVTYSAGSDYSGTYRDVAGNSETFVNVEAIGGTSMADTFVGGSGDEIFRSFGGNDTVNGGDGYDQLQLTKGDGTGWDSTSATNPTIGATINFATGTITGGWAGTSITFSNIEKVSGTNYADTFYGGNTNAPSAFRGLGGADTYIGGTGGNDRVDYYGDASAGGTNGVTVNLVTGTATDGFGNAEAMTGVENIHGTNYADTITGDANANDFVGFAGDDTLSGGDGSDTLNGGAGFDILDGGNGSDWTSNYRDVWYEGATSGVTVNLSTGQQTDAFGNTDTLISIENAMGTQLADNLIGDANNNTFRGFDGADYYNGGDGIDTIQAFGNGLYSSWADASAVHQRGTQGWTMTWTSAGSGTLIDQFGDTDTFDNIERGRGTMVADTFIGSDDTQYFRGLAGNDSFNGGAGNDWVEYGDDASFGGTAGVTVDLAVGTATDGFGDTDSLVSIENVSGTAYADTLTGNTDANTLSGQDGADSLDGDDGDDTIYGGAGADLIYGGAGADIIYGGDGDDVIYGDTVADVTSPTASTEAAAADNDIIYGDAGNDTIYGGVGSDTIYGGAGDDVIYGNDWGDTLYGGAGNDILYDDWGTTEFNGGDFGDATLCGGEGDDILNGDIGDNAKASYEDATSGVSVSLAISGSQAVGGGLGSDTLINIQGLIGSSYADTLIGNANANTLSGGAGDDTLNGGAGADTLYGGSGNDTLDGGTGADTMYGGSGNDTYVVDDASDVVSEESTGSGIDDGGTDLVIVSFSNAYTLGNFVENLTLIGSAHEGYGNAGANVMTGSINSGNYLQGYSGDDTLIGGNQTDRLFGDAGNDTLIGGAGNDQLIGDSGNDALEGDAGNDFLSGGYGNDILDGGTGADQLLGGSGNDTYVVDDAGDTVDETGGDSIDDGGTDLVKSSISYTLGNYVENLMLTGSAAINGTGNALNNILTGNSGANILTGGAGADTLTGGSGTDTFAGSLAELNGDVITDYAFGEKIVLTSSLTSAADVQLTTSGSDTLLSIDGDDNGSFETVITLTGTINGAVQLSDDGVGGTNNVIQILSLNTVAIISGETDGDRSVTEDVDSAATGTLSIVDPDDGEDQFQAVTSGTANYGTYALASDGAWTYTLNSADAAVQALGAGSTLTDSFEAWSADGSASATVTITITGTNDAPTIEVSVPGDRTVTEDTDADASGSLSISDADTGQSSFQGVASGTASHGSYTLTSNGAWTYTLNDADTAVQALKTGQTLTDSFVAWSADNTASKTVTITINGTNDVAVISGEDEGDLSVTKGLDSSASGTLTIVDPDTGENHFQAIASGTASHGTYTLASGGGWTYTLNNADAAVQALSAGQTLTDSFVATSADGSTTATITITINGADNVINGNSGNNTLTGTASVDLIYGFGGNDTLAGLGSGDTLDGGDGVDTASYAASGAAVNVSLFTGTGSGGDAEGDALANIENLTGSAYNDLLEGNSGTNVLTGGAGTDTVTYENATAGVTVSLALTTAQNTIGAGTDTLATIENVIGSAYGDTLTGDKNANVLTGGDGNDRLDGGAGTDTLIGGLGDDTYVVDNAGDVADETDGDGTDTVLSSATFTLASGIENLTLTGTSAINGTGNDDDNVLTGNSGVNTLTGLGGDDTLDGGSGNDTLYGGDGDDTLTGGAGIDKMYGGAGDDTYYVDNTGDVADETTGDGTDTVRSSVTFTLGAGIETLILTGTGAINGTGNALDNEITGNAAANLLSGAAGADTLSGLGGADTLIGGAGADTLDGGDGVDTASYATSTVGVTVSLLDGTGSGGDAEGDTLSNIENLTGSNYNDTLEGDANANVLAGGTGSDTVTYENATAGVTVNLSLTSAQNTVGAGTDTLSGIENVIGSADDDTLTGDKGANVLSGGDGNDRLDGGAGADRLIGGLGDDTYVVDNIGDVADETDGDGTDLVQSSVTFTLGAGIENLTLSGTKAINGTGNDGDNILTGNSGVNTLTGLSGDDTLTGGSGNDTLYGGDGDDTLDGGVGTDKMYGGAGDDTYYVDNAKDVTDETTGDGTDTVYASVTCTIGTGIENLILTGTGAINGTGNALDNEITGNAGNNVLTGGAGADTLDGGDGVDTASYAGSSVGVTVSLTTGSGIDGDADGDTLTNIENLTGSNYNDVLEGDANANVLAGGTGIDLVTYEDATAGVTVNLSLTAAQNTIGAGVDTLSGIENLVGSAYADTLTGTKSANVLTGGDGNDRLDGGAGADTLLWRRRRRHLYRRQYWRCGGRDERGRHGSGAVLGDVHAGGRRREPDADRDQGDQRHRQRRRQHPDRQQRGEHADRRRRQRHADRRGGRRQALWRCRQRHLLCRQRQGRGRRDDRRRHRSGVCVGHLHARHRDREPDADRDGRDQRHRQRAGQRDRRQTPPTTS